MKIIEIKTYEGVGDLNVPTSRGDIKAKTGDTILTFDDGSRWVQPKEFEDAEVEIPVDEPIDEPAIEEAQDETQDKAEEKKEDGGLFN